MITTRDTILMAKAIIKKANGDRNYKREYENYHSDPRQKKRRAQRNASRRKMEALGHVRKGDKKDVHHRNHNTSDDSVSNLGVTSQTYNRSKNKHGR